MGHNKFKPKVGKTSDVSEQASNIKDDHKTHLLCFQVLSILNTS
jgi:hypothetical protein